MKEKKNHVLFQPVWNLQKLFFSWLSHHNLLSANLRHPARSVVEIYLLQEEKLELYGERIMKSKQLMGKCYISRNTSFYELRAKQYIHYETIAWLTWMRQNTVHTVQKSIAVRKEKTFAVHQTKTIFICIVSRCVPIRTTPAVLPPWAIYIRNP